MTTLSRHCSRAARPTATMGNWTTENEEDLIDYYEVNRIMYDSSSTEWRDRDKKKSVRDMIAKRLKITGKYGVFALWLIFPCGLLQGVSKLFS